MSMLDNPTNVLIDVTDPRGNAIRRQSLDCSGEPSLTQQSFVDECDINNIIAKYKVTGLAPQRGPGMFGDFTSIPDYQESLNIVIRGREAFESLPSKVRTDFNNNPAEFLQFANDPANADDLRKWGLLPPAEVKSATLDDVVEVLKAPKGTSEPPQGA